MMEEVTSLQIKTEGGPPGSADGLDMRCQKYKVDQQLQSFQQEQLKEQFIHLLNKEGENYI